MSGIEIAGLVLGAVGLMGLVPIFKEGYLLAKSHRQQRHARLLAIMDQNTATLENETQNGETMVESRYKGYYTAYGKAFARGDGKLLLRSADSQSPDVSL